VSYSDGGAEAVMQPLQSQEEIESPSKKQSRVEVMDDALQKLSSPCANLRAISSNHDSSKLRKKHDDARAKPALSCENHRDKLGNTDSVIGRKEIPSHSSPHTTNGSAADRTTPVVRSKSACSDCDLPSRNPPMKRARILSEGDYFIRIPTSPQTQITRTKEKAVTPTDKNHITNNNTANSTSSKKIGEKKKSLSMAVHQVSANNAIANSSTTESASISKPTPTPIPASATAIQAKVNISENMIAPGKEEKDSPPLKKVEHLIKSEIVKDTAAITSKETLQSPTTSSRTTKEVIQPKQSITEKARQTVKVLETSVEPMIQSVVKESAEISKKTETAAMSIIKNSSVLQALSSASTPSLPANQINAAGNSGVKVSMNSSSVPSTPTAPTATEKKVSPGNKRKRSGSSVSASSQKSKGQSSGRWTQEEHQDFLEGLTECGREWKKVALCIPTRTSAQIRSHAQKYFAKLQRDQESSASNANVAMLHGDLSTPLTPVGPGIVVLGEGGRISGTIITSPGATALAPSVRRNVQRIVANPRAAQREVEDTMEALRERYRQLQQRLEDRRQSREGHKISRGQQHTLSSEASNTGASSEISTFASSPGISQKQKQTNRLSSSRKRMHLPINPRSRPYSSDETSVCSNVSSIAASRTDLGDEEIIALHVLGDALPHSESASDLQVLGAEVLHGDGTMPSMHDNMTSSPYDQLAPLPGVGTDNDSLMNQGASVTSNGGGDAATSESLSVGGISAN
jgi:SHAQKYF class myb-like DNA-binding protein